MATPARNVPRKAWRPMLWLLPIVVLIGCEAIARVMTDRVPRWYGAAERIAEASPVDALFLGSSRVEAAVPTEAFANAVAARGGRRPVALNLGRGYSTLLEHYLGVRDLIQAQSGNLHGVTVFVEAVGGVGYADRWTGEWAMREQHQLLVDLLRLRDLPAFWRSGQDTTTKVIVTGRFFARQIAVINRRERLRSLFLEPFAPAGASSRTVGEDLLGPGPASSIRTDPEALRTAREMAEQLAAEFERSPERTGAWAGTVMDDLARLVHQAGGRLVFFAPPESSMFVRLQRLPAFREDAATFAGQVRQWGACLVQPRFTYTDADLPDLWHLRPERSPEFAATLVDAWLAQCSSGL